MHGDSLATRAIADSRHVHDAGMGSFLRVSFSARLADKASQLLALAIAFALRSNVFFSLLLHRHLSTIPFNAAREASRSQRERQHVPLPQSSPHGASLVR